MGDPQCSAGEQHWIPFDWGRENVIYILFSLRGMSRFFGLLSDDWILVLGIKMAMLVKEMLEFVNKFELYCTFLIKCGRQLLNYFQHVFGAEWERMDINILLLIEVWNFSAVAK